MGSNSGSTLGLQHLSLADSRLSKFDYYIKRLNIEGTQSLTETINHSDSTSFYYSDPDGNEVEITLNQFSTQKKDHKRYHQFTRDFGGMSESNFDSDAPDYTWLDREEVRRLVKEGHL